VEPFDDALNRVSFEAGTILPLVIERPIETTHI